MISRGYFVGEIIDALSSVSQQVETRCALGLTDLNKYLEDFFLYIINETLELRLVNFNQTRCNAPGLDLIDEVNDIGFQVTSTKTSQKVNDTLEAVLRLDKPPRKIHILIIGKAQGSYTLDELLCKKTKFSEQDIWDLNTLCKKMIEISIDKLQTIYNYLKKELVRVKIELEIPNESGDYSTTIKNHVEKIPKPTLTSFDTYHNYLTSHNNDFELSLKEVKQDFLAFINKLSKLPRITREFYAFLLERKDTDCDLYSDFQFNFNRLKRLCHFSYLDEEITLLTEYGFIEYNKADDYEKSPYIRIFGKCKSDHFILDFVEYTESNSLSYTKPIVHLDFSQY